jgi:hypothetical protein
MYFITVDFFAISVRSCPEGRNSISQYCLLIGLQQTLHVLEHMQQCAVLSQRITPIRRVCRVLRKLSTSEHELCNTVDWSFKQGIARYEDLVL